MDTIESIREAFPARRTLTALAIALALTGVAAASADGFTAKGRGVWGSEGVPELHGTVNADTGDGQLVFPTRLIHRSKATQAAQQITIRFSVFAWNADIGKHTFFAGSSATLLVPRGRAVRFGARSFDLGLDTWYTGATRVIWRTKSGRKLGSRKIGFVDSADYLCDDGATGCKVEALADGQTALCFETPTEEAARDPRR